MEETYNGWRNYETWLLSLNIDNDEGIYNNILEEIKDGSLNDANSFQRYIEELTFIGEHGIYKICDVWTQRDWDTIDFKELFDNYKQDQIENEEYEKKKGQR